MVGRARGGDLGSGPAALLKAVDCSHGGFGGDGGLKKTKELGSLGGRKMADGKSAGKSEFWGEFQISKTDAFRTGALFF